MCRERIGGYRELGLGLIKSPDRVILLKEDYLAHVTCQGYQIYMEICSKVGENSRKRSDITKRKHGDFKVYMAHDLNDDSWNLFVVKEEAYRHSIACIESCGI